MARMKASTTDLEEGGLNCRRSDRGSAGRHSLVLATKWATCEGDEEGTTNSLWMRQVRLVDLHRDYSIRLMKLLSSGSLFGQVDKIRQADAEA